MSTVQYKVLNFYMKLIQSPALDVAVILETKFSNPF